jgi:hypothetical protein
MGSLASWTCARAHAGALSLALVQTVAGCGGDSNAADGGSTDATMFPPDGEPEICLEFTKAGAPCSHASPVRCFAECDAGGCYCSQSPGGARWTCITDLACVPDCGPLDDGCSPMPLGDDGSTGDDGGGADAGAVDASATAEGGMDASDGGGADAAEAGPSDASSG